MDEQSNTVVRVGNQRVYRTIRIDPGLPGVVRIKPHTIPQRSALYVTHLVEQGVDQGGLIMVVWNHLSRSIAMEALLHATYYLETRSIRAKWELGEFILEGAAQPDESGNLKVAFVEAAILRRESD